MYDVIVIGATFAAAGLIQAYGEKCLVLERRPQAGYEFFNAVNFGTDYDTPLVSDEAKKLYDVFKEKNAFNGERICLFKCAMPFYGLLENKNVLLNMEIISVDKLEDGYCVSAHGVSGLRTFTAKKIIDTTVHKEMIEAKSLNILVNADSETDLVLPEELNFETKMWGYEEDTLIKCYVDADADYIMARNKIADTIELLPQAYKVALVADCFDYVIKPGYPCVKQDVTYMPSCAYKNPLLAFDAGILYAKGGVM